MRVLESVAAGAAALWLSVGAFNTAFCLLSLLVVSDHFVKFVVWRTGSVYGLIKEQIRGNDDASHFVGIILIRQNVECAMSKI